MSCINLLGVLVSFTFLTDSFAVSPQIALTDVALLREQGFVAIVCNRLDNEDPGQPSAADMSAACDVAGLAFAHIPMNGPHYTAEDLQALRTMMEKGKTFAYCRSGNRSSILWKAAQ